MKWDPKHTKEIARRGRPKRAPSNSGTVLLIAMPWQSLNRPSIQLGILQSVLNRAGVRTEVRSLWLPFMEYCLAETAHRPEAEQIRLRDYEAVSQGSYAVGLGDWIFAVPPFPQSLDGDESYLSYLRGQDISESDIAKALIFRDLVPAFLEHCVEEILAVAPRVAGFTSTLSQNVPSLVLARLLKLRAPSVSIVFGGGNCQGPMGAALHKAFPWVDFVVRGEAERVLPELVRDLLAGRPVRRQAGLCYREGDRSIAIDATGATPISMDEIPTPVFEEYFERLEKTSFRNTLMTEVYIPYESARGCWWGAKSHCAFCGLNGGDMAFRSKSPDRVVEEVLGLVQRYGRLDFSVVDKIIDLRHLREVLPRFREAGHDITLYYATKTNLRREEVRLLREAGANHIQPGIESLSTPILRLMRKGVTAFQNVRLLKWCALYGIRVYWNVIYGLPGEPPEEYARMAEAVLSLTHLEPPTLCLLTIDRFSPYHERPGEFGLELVGPLSWYRLVYALEPATLANLASTFEHRHADGRDPKAYVESLRCAIKIWESNRAVGYRSLRYRRGPGFLIVHDRRPKLEAADYTFGEREARLYLACEEGATPLEAARALQGPGMAGVTDDEAREYLDALVTMRLMYKENDHYLALALPATLPEVSRET